MSNCAQNTRKRQEIKDPMDHESLHAGQISSEYEQIDDSRPNDYTSTTEQMHVTTVIERVS